MSKREAPKRDERQLRLGFEPERGNGAERWCAVCQCWTDVAMFDLFHGFGHPKRPYDRPEPAK